MIARLLALLVCLLPAQVHADGDAEAVRKAIDRGLRRLEQGSANYIKNRQCFSCHHQALTLAALHSAKARGFPVDGERIKAQIDFTVNTFKPKRERVSKGEAVAGGNTMSAYALFTLEASGYPADDTTGALVQYLLARQKADGSFPALAQRPPTEGSAFTNTSLALRALQVYGSAAEIKDEKQRERIDKAFDKGREWLLANKPKNTEDRMFHLRGLVVAKVDQAVIDAAREMLLKEQREDGSWSQLPDLMGDAYATGGVLMSLRQAGVKPSDPAFRKGVQFLIRTQKEDGSWFVETRSKPVQIFFDNGDPGGKSQFISFAATGWAVLALLETCAEK
jgi:N-acyl-D-amino-acid deacylase